MKLPCGANFKQSPPQFDLHTNLLNGDDCNLKDVSQFNRGTFLSDAIITLEASFEEENTASPVKHKNFKASKNCPKNSPIY